MSVPFSIGYPDITWDAVSVTASEASGFPVRNLFYGGSNLVWKRSGNATSTNITFDMGLTRAASANYCVLRGINLTTALQGSNYGVSVQVRASIDNFVSSNILIAEQNPIVLLGTKDEDALILFDTTPEYRYWRVVINTASSIQHAMRKLFLGRRFDFNNNQPYYPYSSNYADDTKPFVSDSGSLFKSSSGRKQKRLAFNWRNVSDFNRDVFHSRVIEAKDDSPICLIHQSDVHNPLSVYRPQKDIADFAPVAAYEAEGSRLFTDTAGTTPAAYGEQVARWNEPFNGHNATQATAGSRPFRATAPITGVRNTWNYSEPASGTGYATTTGAVFRSAVQLSDHVPHEVYLEDATISRQITQNFPTGSLIGKTWTLSFLVKMDNGLMPNQGSGNYRDFTITWENSDQTNYSVFNYEDKGNGVYRVSATRSFTGTNVSITIRKYIGLNTNTGISISAIQFEEASSASPYQRRVTRHEVYEQGVPNRDYLFLGGSTNKRWMTIGTALGRPANYTIIAVTKSYQLAGQAIVFAGDGTANNYLTLQFRAASGDGFVPRLSAAIGDGVAGSTTFSELATPTDWRVPNISASRYTSGNDFVDLFFQGQKQNLEKVTSAASANTGANKSLSIGRAGSFDSEYFNGEIYAIYIFDKSLSDADLTRFQALASQKWQVANLEYPANTNPDIFTGWIQNYNVVSGAWANINNINMEIIEDVS
jgi:hypothetical protein